MRSDLLPNVVIIMGERKSVNDGMRAFSTYLQSPVVEGGLFLTHIERPPFRVDNGRHWHV